ncbi:MAG TPA: ribbon-helix-helix protein, CopG family [Thermoanaerobaculia bacterium]|nr:ribbon-helix-helix protein, CopG family [Thermoanaerobaculia bacterium]
MEPELHQALQEKAAATDRTISDLIKEAVREDLEEETEDLAAIQERADERGIPFEEVVQELHGYSIQGVLYELSDPDYQTPEEGEISFQVDTRDGRHWVCHVDKRIAPPNLNELWRTEVLVTGAATIRARKPMLEVDTFVALPGVSDPVKALDGLITLCGDLRGEPLQAFMDRIRERD